MNMTQMMNMVMRLVMRKPLNKGVNAGINALARRGVGALRAPRQAAPRCQGPKMQRVLPKWRPAAAARRGGFNRP